MFVGYLTFWSVNCYEPVSSLIRLTKSSSISLVTVPSSIADSITSWMTWSSSWKHAQLGCHGICAWTEHALGSTMLANQVQVRQTPLDPWSSPNFVECASKSPNGETKVSLIRAQTKFESSTKGFQGHLRAPCSLTWLIDHLEDPSQRFGTHTQPIPYKTPRLHPAPLLFHGHTYHHQHQWLSSCFLDSSASQPHDPCRFS